MLAETRRSRERSILIPKTKTVYKQSFNILNKKIKGKVNMSSVNKYQEFIMDYPSISYHHYLWKLILYARDHQQPSTFNDGTFKTVYLIHPEISEIIPLSKMCRFRNAFGKSIVLHAAHISFLDTVMQNKNLNMFEAIQRFYIFSLEYIQDLKQKKIRLQQKWINGHLRNRTIPPKYAEIPTYEHLVPEYCYYLNEMIIGADESSKDHWETGRLKTKLNCAIYKIIDDEIDGECNLLESSIPVFTDNEAKEKDDIIKSELRAHKFYLPNATRILNKNKASKVKLRRKKKRTKSLLKRLNEMTVKKKRYKTPKELMKTNIDNNKYKARRR
eukprot:419654_1